MAPTEAGRKGAGRLLLVRRACDEGLAQQHVAAQRPGARPVAQS